jgi:hypothetical protein
VNFQRSTGRYNPEDSTLQNHRCETSNSVYLYLFIYVFICDLFNDAVGSYDYIALNDMIINEY